MRRLGGDGSNKWQHSDGLARGDPGSYNRHHIASQLRVWHWRTGFGDRVVPPPDESGGGHQSKKFELSEESLNEEGTAILSLGVCR